MESQEPPIAVQDQELEARAVRPRARIEGTTRSHGNQKSRRYFVSKDEAIAILAVLGIALHLVLRYVMQSSDLVYNVPLFTVLLLGGGPLVYGLLLKGVRREFGSDLLAGISIVVSVMLGQYLAGSLVVLMLSGGNVLEGYAVRSASSVLEALAKRMPSIAHEKHGAKIIEVALDEIEVGDALIVYPHEVCPVDGVVIEGHGVMDESYLTGEPFRISKAPGSEVLSGAINGEKALTIRASKLPVDSRYANIMKVMRAAQQNRPRLRRLGDQLGAYYTPLAVAVAIGAWLFSGSEVRFLSVLVIATPCPLLIAIPVSIIGSISLAAKRGIVVRDPAVLEQVGSCRTVILDKTGTLTYGIPTLTDQIVAPGFDRKEILALVAAVEQYSKHPLARAILRAAEESALPLAEAREIAEPPGEGLRGVVSGSDVWITSRAKLLEQTRTLESNLPAAGAGLECVIAIEGVYAATYRFHDTPRAESKPFLAHLPERHGFNKMMLVSGDRESEVRYLADLVGIDEVYASQSPEQKVALVRRETATAKTLFLGDGINDAPSLTTATVGVALGQRSEVTTEAAGAVIMDASLGRVDEFFHIGRRMRSIALQSAVGGLALSLVGMGFAATGHLSPVQGALAQEIIDVLAILNALRVALPPRELIDY